MTDGVVSKNSNARKCIQCLVLWQWLWSVRLAFMSSFYPWQLLLVTLVGWIKGDSRT